MELFSSYLTLRMMTKRRKMIKMMGKRTRITKTKRENRQKIKTLKRKRRNKLSQKTALSMGKV